MSNASPDSVSAVSVMTLNLEVWRQKNASDSGKFVSYRLPGVSPDMSFLEMLDLLNEQIIKSVEPQLKWKTFCAAFSVDLHFGFH